MKRRTFWTSSLALLVAAQLPRARGATASELPILSRTGKQLLLSGAEVDELKGALHGKLLRASDEGYEQARRIWNGAFDRHPAAIVRCVDAADVVNAVQFAASHDLLVAVRGGGHSLPGHSVCQGGLMIDLSPMREVRIDVASRRAEVAPGVLLGELDREAQRHGLIVPAGTVSHTGVSGLTLGGGFGRLSRKLGLSIDSLLEADLVMASGKSVRVNAEENPELFWAIRGGGGNFGVVSRFMFRAHELETSLFGGDLIYPFEQARAVLGFIAEYSITAPDELWIDPVLECAPDGTRRLLVNVCHCGDPGRAARDIAAIRKFRKPAEDNTRTQPFVALQTAHDAQSPHGRGYYMGGGFVPELSAALLDHAMSAIEKPGAQQAKISLTQHGGAIARLAPDATAFANRKASHNVVVRASWDDPAHAAQRTQWHRDTWKGFEPFSRGAYANLNLASADAKVLGAYGPNFEKLTALKTKYDPSNLFHLNPNIKPSGGA